MVQLALMALEVERICESEFLVARCSRWRRRNGVETYEKIDDSEGVKAALDFDVSINNASNAENTWVFTQKWR